MKKNHSIFLYFGDYETNNPLGSLACKQKFGAVYNIHISLSSCLPDELSSILNNIFLILMSNSIELSLETVLFFKD